MEITKEEKQFILDAIELYWDNFNKDHIVNNRSKRVSESLVKKLDLCDVVGQSEQLKTKFTVGQKVVVCNELYTTVTRIEGDKYWFTDDDGKEWYETEVAITAV